MPSTKNYPPSKDKDSSYVTLSEIYTTLHFSYPVMIGLVLQTLISLTAVVFVGQLGTQELAAVSLGTMCSNVMGFSVGIGFASAIDTLASQAFGAGNYHALGTITQRAILILGMLCLPLCVLWWYAYEMLVALGQDPTVSALTGVYMRYQMIGLWPQFIYTSLNKYLQTQGITKPSMYIVLVVALLNPPMTYVCMYPLGMGFDGAALAVSLSRVLQLILLSSYIYLSGVYHDTWIWSWECFHHWGQFFKLGTAGCVMVCSEWWAAEILTLLAGLIGTEELAAQAVLSNMNGLMFSVPLSFSIVCSIRVGNQLGAGHPRGAQVSWQAALVTSQGFMLCLASLLVLFSNQWPYLFTTNPDVVALDNSLVYFLAFYALVDAIQIVAAGALRGCGQQKVGALANLFAYYIVGLPLSYVAAFHLHLGIYGLWMGASVANMLQSLLLLVAVYKINWLTECQLAKSRLRGISSASSFSTMDTDHPLTSEDLLLTLPVTGLTPTGSHFMDCPAVVIEEGDEAHQLLRRKSYDTIR